MAVLGAVAVLFIGVFAQSAGAQTVWTCNGVPATIIGTPLDDVLRGTSGPDVIVGREGNDVIMALDGHVQFAVDLEGFVGHDGAGGQGHHQNAQEHDLLEVHGGPPWTRHH